ncbi:hypothetical protein [Streptomyces glaucescens]|uniref:Uncharacterized protein n=1 Tax=Streptomyces glaucescens TaxID=1907 RepID=A0A089XB32_STRGA|nr:hypothetical protein [Streptomyces glaucescens]AIR98339.1 hypothetical protein SGLAU_11690 [Streptomyces glaucescens]
MSPQLGHLIREDRDVNGATLAILAIAGLASISLFALKGVLDQLPDVIDSAGKVRDALERFKQKQDEAAKPEEQEPPAESDEPPMAA